jgi:polyphosphate kinase
VRVELVVRDSCRLRPGLPGLSENIRVVSVVGRFLEHSRIYEFRNGGEEEVYIGSADCMKRNLESRVEVLVPVTAREPRKELGKILDALLSDSRGAWELSGDGTYQKVQPGGGEAPRSAQQILLERAVKQHRQATRLKRRGPQQKPAKARR